MSHSRRFWVLLGAVVATVAVWTFWWTARQSTKVEGFLTADFLAPTDGDATYDFGDRLDNEFKVSWYGKVLSAMKEPSLSSIAEPEIEVYRFLWLRSFERPIAVRIQQSGEKRALRSKQLNRIDELDENGVYDPGSLSIDKIRPISAEEWEELIQSLGRADYWTLETAPQEPAPPGFVVVGFDGEEWILEGVRNGKYHIVDR